MAAVDDAPPRVQWWRRLGSVEVLALAVIVVVVLRGWLVGLTASPVGLDLTSVFVSLLLQALPFLVFGSAMRAAIVAFLPPALIEGKHPLLLAVLMSPALSPVVIACTAVAFPDHPALALARVLAGAAVAVLGALLWRRLGQAPLAPRLGPGGWASFVDTGRADLIRGAGLFVIGAAVISVLTAGLPPRWLDTLAAYPLVAVLAAALLAVLLSQRPHADAVLAAAVGQFSLTARLVFLIVGPAVNLRTFSRHNVRYGTPFALRFAPALLLAATLVASLVGWILL